MRILHTGDWHLGRHFEGHPLEADHETVLEQVLQALVTHAADALVIAGDVFDRAAPPETAVRQFNRFIARVGHETGAAIVLIAGNHDSGDRIGAMAMFADGTRALVRGPLSRRETPLLLADAHGPVAISALPFAYEHAARECFADPDIKAPADVMRAQVAAARQHVPRGARWVVVAHAFVNGGAGSESERPLSRVVGGIETVPAEVFAGAHYVALGHLHKPQRIAAQSQSAPPHIRYSGAPLAFGFDEECCAKSMSLVDLAADGTATVELIPFAPLRHARTLRGTLADILTDADLLADAAPTQDFIRVVLTDPTRLVDPMKRIRERYPNACTLQYERDLAAVSPRAGRPRAAALDDPAAVVGEFMTFTRGTPPSPAEAAIVAEALAASTARREAAA